MNTIFRTLTSLLIAWFAMTSEAQSIRFFPADETLSNSLISVIYQDSIGYVWIGTSDGLYRYDGYKVVTYRHDTDNDRSLLFNKVLCVNNDAEGRLLVGTRKMGLQLYNYETNDFTTIPLGDGNTGVYKIYTAPDGVTYILTVRHGIKKLSWNGTTAMTESMKFLPDGVWAEKMLVDNTGAMWLAANGGRLFRRLGTGQATEVKFNSEGGKPYITSIFLDSHGAFFAGTEHQGLFVFDSIKGEMRKLTQDIPVSILDILQADAAHLYVATDGDGMKLVDITTGAVSSCFTNITRGDMRHDKLVSLCSNRNGDLWVGAYRKGFYFCPKTDYGFKYLAPTFHSLQNDCNYITALTADNKNGVWAAVESNGLFHFDDKGQQTGCILYGKENGIPSDVMALCVTTDGRLWISSYRHNIGWIEPSVGIYHQLTSSQGDGLDFTRVNGIAEATDHSLWFSTTGNGLIHYNPQDKQAIWYSSKAKARSNDCIFHDYLFCINMSKQGRVFFGTGNGIGCFDTVKKSFLNVFGKDHIFHDISINDICIDRDGNLWAASDEGLLFYDMHSRKEQHFTVTDGLPSNTVCDVKIDVLGNLWVSTVSGLARMNSTDKSIMRYYATDGLQGNEFSSSASATSSDGTFYFGGINGITYFHPDKIIQVKRSLRLWPTELLVGNVNVTTLSKSGGNAIIDRAITDVEHINLSYRDATFSIGFSTFSFIGEMGVTYYYNINGGDWQSIRRGDNHVSFTNLSPGRYTLRVKARAGDMESNIRKIYIIVSPPWYASRWAYVIYLILTAVVAFFLYRRYRERQQEKLNEMRLRFFTDISHDIRTPMTLIISPLDSLLKDTSLSVDIHKTLQLMQTNANRILELVNQLLTIRKVDREQMQLQCRETDMVSYLGQSYRMFEQQARTHKIKFTFDHPMDELLAWVDTSFLDKVVNNLLGNALKYTPDGGRIDLCLSLGKDEKAEGALADYFQVEVVDTGTGLDPDEIPHLFERFYRSRHSLEAGGTGIGLNLCEALISRHHGVIAAENRNDGTQGSRFYFRLPLGRSYLLTEEIAPAEKDEPEPSKLTHASMEEDHQPVKRSGKSGFRLLVIDDDADLRDYLVHELGRNYTVISASNGKEGLQLALSRMPDLIICDVMMPGMDGYEFVKELKHNPNINDIPVILLTAKGESRDRIEGLGRGADAYIVKPFHLDELNIQIRNLISNRQRLRGKYSGQQDQKDRVENVEIQSGDEQLMECIMKAVNNHLDDSDYKTEQLASDVGVSRVHLNRKMKELTGVSPGEFVRNLRLKQAAKLLSEKQGDISQIAYSCGFSSISVFSTAFKKCYGVSPSAYIEQVTPEK